MIAMKLDELFESKNLDKLTEIYEIITKNILTVKDTGIRYRVINHWDEKGLLRFSRKVEEGNRKFSLVDFVWIKVVDELREFGLKIPEVKRIADEIYTPLPMKEIMDLAAMNIDHFKEFEGQNKDEYLEFLKSGEYKTADFSDIGIEFNYLQLLLVEAVMTRQPISIIVFKGGDWFPYIRGKEDYYPEELLYRKEFSSYISIGITDILFKHVTEDKFQSCFEGLHIFTTNETTIINYLKKGNYKKITVQLKGKNSSPIEFKKQLTTMEQVLKLIRLKQYKEFVVVDNKNNEVVIGNKKN